MEGGIREAKEVKEKTREKSEKKSEKLLGFF